MKSKAIIRSLILIILIVMLGLLLKTTGFGLILDKNWIDVHVQSKGLEGQFIYLVVTVLLVTVGFPRQIISFLAGYAFGLYYGTLIALIACAIGCGLTFFFARLVGRDWVKSRFPRRLSNADQFFSANTFVTTLLIRFMPAGSNFVTNLVAGVSGAGAISFIGGSTLGYIPQTVIFALLGSGFNIDDGFQITLSALLFASSVFLGLLLYQKYKRFGLEEVSDNCS